MKKFAKILLACFCLLLVAAAMLLGYSEWTVSDTRHYTYDDVDAVPYNRVALVLGTSKYLIGGSPNHYFKYRIKAAAELEKEGIDVEILDLRTIRPMDTDAIIRSVMDSKPTPVASRWLTMRTRSANDRPSLSSRHTTSVSALRSAFRQ